MHIRDEWIKHTEFHPHSSAEVLNEVIERAKKVLEERKLPIVVFDLDSTLFDVSKRSYEILREWLAHPESMSFQPAREQLMGVEPADIEYSLQDVWEKKKVPHDVEPYSKHFKLARDFWKTRFFGHDYLKHDEPTEGAVEFVKRLYEMGVQIVYLTGRDVPQMAFGTFDQLKKHGLPIDVERTRLILKPRRRMNDIDFKGTAAKTISEWGEVVASFENEPKNLVAMSNAFGPNTMNVFIQTVSSDHAAPAGKGIYRIDRFE
jgi:beta-phosphoglucomutase-like phosphatase (HAD superfamily)